MTAEYAAMPCLLHTLSNGIWAGGLIIPPNLRLWFGGWWKPPKAALHIVEIENTKLEIGQMKEFETVWMRRSFVQLAHFITSWRLLDKRHG